MVESVTGFVRDKKDSAFSLFKPTAGIPSQPTSGTVWLIHASSAAATNRKRRRA